MPVDLVIVRHGQSEGNLAKRRSEGGDHSAFSDAFMQRHTSTFRLTNLGRAQARAAGTWLAQEFPGGFDRYVVSEYIRAMETAGELNLPNARWYCEPYLTERDWGDLDHCPEHEREEKFGKVLARRDTQPYFWKPPNGESFQDLGLRVDRVLGTLHRECRDKRVLQVCHGEVMWAFRVRMERMSQSRFKQLHLSKEGDDRIYNCQVIHYTRRNPENSLIAPYMNWRRMVRPVVPLGSDLWDTGWVEIERPRYSNDDLLSLAHEIPSLVA